MLYAKMTQFLTLKFRIDFHIMKIMCDEIIICSSEVQLMKHAWSIDITDDGINILFYDVQQLKTNESYF